jgi:hypothetical protein
MPQIGASATPGTDSAQAWASVWSLACELRSLGPGDAMSSEFNGFVAADRAHPRSRRRLLSPTPSRSSGGPVIAGAARRVRSGGPIATNAGEASWAVRLIASADHAQSVRLFAVDGGVAENVRDWFGGFIVADPSCGLPDITAEDVWAWPLRRPGQTVVSGRRQHGTAGR